MRLFKILIFCLLLSTSSYAAVNQITEEDGTPSVFPWKIKFANGLLTDNGDGSLSVASPAESDPLSLHLDGSNANTDIDIGSFDLTTTGTITANQFTATSGGVFGAMTIYPGDSHLLIFTDDAIDIWNDIFLTANFNLGQYSGANKTLQHYGYITDLSDERYVQWQVDDSDDYFWLTRQDSSILGFKIDMPVDLVDNNFTTTGTGTLGTGYIGDATDQLQLTFDPTDNSSPAYTNIGGTGNRTTIITVTSTAINGVDYRPLFSLVDGVNPPLFFGCYWNAGNFLNKYVRFDFGEGSTKRITEVTLEQQSGAVGGTWQWQGSNNGTDWTNIGDTWTITTGTSQVLGDISANTVGYRYYQMIGTAGSKGADPWIYEIKFKIDDYGVSSILQTYDGGVATGILSLQTEGGIARIAGLQIDQGGNVATTGKFLLGALAVDDDTIVVDATNHRVGISQAEPLFALHVNGTIASETGTIYVGYYPSESQHSTLVHSTAGNNSLTISSLYAGNGNLISLKPGTVEAFRATRISSSRSDLQLVSDNNKISLGAGNDATLNFNGSGLVMQSDAVTATDYLQLRGGTNGIDFNIGATEQITLTDGKLAPTTTNDIDFGDTTHFFKDSYLGRVYLEDTSTYFDNNSGDIDVYTTTNKTLELQTSVYNDANVGSLVLQTGGTLPGIVEILDKDGDATGVYSRGFAVNEQGSGSIEIPHDYVEGTNLVFHVHWMGQDSPTGTDKVKWQVTYSITREEVVTPDTITDSAETDFDTQYEWKRTDVETIDGTNLKIGDQVNFTIKRIAASADEYGGEAVVGTIGFHYQVNTLGSRTITTK